jgi:hypothetical protein
MQKSNNKAATSRVAAHMEVTALKITPTQDNTHEALLPIQEETLRVIKLTQHELWSEVLRYIESHHVTVNCPNASQIVDLTLELQELLEINRHAIEEVLHA